VVFLNQFSKSFGAFIGGSGQVALNSLLDISA